MSATESTSVGALSQLWPVLGMRDSHLEEDEEGGDDDQHEEEDSNLDEDEDDGDDGDQHEDDGNLDVDDDDQHEDIYIYISKCISVQSINIARLAGLR